MTDAGNPGTEMLTNGGPGTATQAIVTDAGSSGTEGRAWYGELAFRTGAEAGRSGS